ncbi:sigma 54-interacting transcriptional regulator [Abyssisolibacter fermentans]|uniref:sigma 54-interacting transcriptional regulator n=1 Tax=Abyssisolibacter fermentans TaxID=1766203 RepID=UPI0008366F86|nr:sigma 54-interacting transcriptional regulator [Abyssisolibacter fermentans]
MEFKLIDIQEAVIKYANIISQILQVEVEIADKNLIRIAGTGIFKNRVNKDMCNEGCVYKFALESGETQIIHKPRYHELCLTCLNRNTCEEKFEVCTPIKLKGVPIGVIGLICINEAQKKHLLSNFDVHMEFLQQISEFISIAAYEKWEKVREQNYLKSLNFVIDKIENGVIILNKDKYITHINEKGIKQLKLSDDYSRNIVNITLIGDSFLEFKKYQVTINKRSYNLIGELYKLKLSDEQFDEMLIFGDEKKIKDNISKYTNINQVITCEDILSNSNKMSILKNNIKKISLSNSTVLITGESGTGKELFARAIHNESIRKTKPFIAVNCGAIPDALLESELFGYVKGAFTGANPIGKIGKFELADKGTIFLDEIGDMPIYLQTKLLRVLQEKKITKIGSNKVIDVDIRVIAATNKELIKAIEENKFREDLYYRLNIIPFEVPPLRERITDIRILTNYFIKKYSNLFGKKYSNIEVKKEVWDVFFMYSWPGNVRELENTIEFMINMVDNSGILDLSTIPKSIIQNKREIKKKSVDLCKLHELEKNAIKRALEIYGSTTEGKKAAAKKLGIGIATLYRKMKHYNLSK